MAESSTKSVATADTKPNASNTKPDLKPGTVPESIKVSVRAVLLSKIGGVPLQRFQEDFKKLEGSRLDHQKLGFKTLRACLESMEDVVRFKYSDQADLWMLYGIADPKSYTSSAAKKAQYARPQDGVKEKNKMTKVKKGQGGKFQQGNKGKDPKTQENQNPDEKGDASSNQNMRNSPAFRDNLVPYDRPLEERVAGNQRGLYTVCVGCPKPVAFHDREAVVEEVKEMFAQLGDFSEENYAKGLMFFRYTEQRVAIEIIKKYNGRILMNGVKIKVTPGSEKMAREPTKESVKKVNGDVKNGQTTTPEREMKEMNDKDEDLMIPPQVERVFYNKNKDKAKSPVAERREDGDESNRPRPFPVGRRGYENNNDQRQLQGEGRDNHKKRDNPRPSREQEFRKEGDSRLKAPVLVNGHMVSENKTDSNSDLCVLNLTVSTTNKDLFQHFAAFNPSRAKVYHKVINGPFYSKTVHFGFVAFDDIVSACNAQRALHKSILNGNEIRVELSLTKSKYAHGAEHRHSDNRQRRHSERSNEGSIDSISVELSSTGDLGSPPEIHNEAPTSAFNSSSAVRTENREENSSDKSSGNSQSSSEQEGLPRGRGRGAWLREVSPSFGKGSPATTSRQSAAPSPVGEKKKLRPSLADLASKLEL